MRRWLLSVGLPPAALGGCHDGRPLHAFFQTQRPPIVFAHRGGGVVEIAGIGPRGSALRPGDLLGADLDKVLGRPELKLRAGLDWWSWLPTRPPTA